MRRNWTPSIVPNGHDQTAYLVINNFGKLGTAPNMTGHRCSLASDVMRAINRHVERVFDPSRKDKYWVKREIKEGSMTDGRHLLVIVAW